MLERHRDPRPDIKADHELWTRVLSLAYRTDRDTFGVLHGLRCGGATLQVTEKGRLRMNLDDFQRECEYDGERVRDIRSRWLEPGKDKIITVFRQVEAAL